jgi:hypothetical protein
MEEVVSVSREEELGREHIPHVLKGEKGTREGGAIVPSE